MKSARRGRAVARWRDICARTRAARAEIDAQIRGVRLPDGPVMVLARTGREPTAIELAVLRGGRAPAKVEVDE